PELPGDPVLPAGFGGDRACDLLTRIKANLAAGLPPVFGFTVYSSVAQAGTSGRIPYPGVGEKVLGRHAMLVIGLGKESTGDGVGCADRPGRACAPHARPRGPGDEPATTPAF